MDVANEKRWREFWEKLGAQGNPESPWRQLHAAYTESWRAYHNLNHIDHCLKEFTRVRQLVNDPNAVEAAIWFHDVIYDTRGNDNEERSADVAEAALGAAGLSETLRHHVRALILATKHVETPQSKDASLLVDVDLSILGASSEDYDEFERQIRSEYSWVSENDFAAGRARVLSGFLSRKSIFATEEFGCRFEGQARVNLSRAIKNLDR
jgi:predicted metal-dependent HD superfamily phosphohydrolase